MLIAYRVHVLLTGLMFALHPHITIVFCVHAEWHEPSTRYHGRTLAAFIPFAYALRQAKIIDMFQSPILKRYIGWYRLVQTPPDKTMGNCALTPALADANWESVWEVLWAGQPAHMLRQTQNTQLSSSQHGTGRAHRWD